MEVDGGLLQPSGCGNHFDDSILFKTRENTLDSFDRRRSQNTLGRRMMHLQRLDGASAAYQEMKSPLS